MGEIQLIAPPKVSGPSKTVEEKFFILEMKSNLRRHFLHFHMIKPLLSAMNFRETSRQLIKNWRYGVGWISPPPLELKTWTVKKLIKILGYLTPPFRQKNEASTMNIACWVTYADGNVLSHVETRWWSELGLLLGLRYQRQVSKQLLSFILWLAQIFLSRRLFTIDWRWGVQSQAFFPWILGKNNKLLRWVFSPSLGLLNRSHVNAWLSVVDQLIFFFQSTEWHGFCRQQMSRTVFQWLIRCFSFTNISHSEVWLAVNVINGSPMPDSLIVVLCTMRDHTHSRTHACTSAAVSKGNRKAE